MGDVQRRHEGRVFGCAVVEFGELCLAFHYPDESDEFVAQTNRTDDPRAQAHLGPRFDPNGPVARSYVLEQAIALERFLDRGRRLRVFQRLTPDRVGLHRVLMKREQFACRIFKRDGSIYETAERSREIAKIRSARRGARQFSMDRFGLLEQDVLFGDDGAVKLFRYLSERYVEGNLDQRQSLFIRFISRRRTELFDIARNRKSDRSQTVCRQRADLRALILRPCRPCKPSRQQELAWPDPRGWIGHVDDVRPADVALKSLGPGHQLSASQRLESQRLTNGHGRSLACKHEELTEFCAPATWCFPARIL